MKHPLYRIFFLALVIMTVCGRGYGVAVAAAGDPLHALDSLVSLGESRQVGQSGNHAMDEWVYHRFASAAESGKEAADAFVSEIQAIQAARAELWVDSLLSEVVGPEDVLTASGGTEAWIVANSGWMSVLFIILIASLALTWIFQRRKELVLAGIGFVILLVGLQVKVLLFTEETGPTIVGDPDLIQERMAQLDAAYAEAMVQHGEALRGVWQHGRIHYDAPAFIPGATWLDSEGQSIRVFALAPNLVEPSNLPEDGLEGPLFDLRHVSHRADPPAGAYAGGIVLLDFNSGNRWVEAASLGAKAVLFVEPPEGSPMRFMEAEAKFSNTPLSLPRFLLQRNEIDFINSIEPGTRIRLHGEAHRWQREGVAADWLFVPGADASLAPLILQVHKDSASIVPELAPGATGASNLVVMDRFLNYLKEAQPHRPVLVVAVNDHSNALHGERQFGYFGFAPRAVLDAELGRLNRLIAEADFVKRIYKMDLDEAWVRYLRFESERIAGRNFSPKGMIEEYFKDAIGQVREARRLAEREGLPHSEMEAFDVEIETIIGIQSLFNKYVQRYGYADMGLEERDRIEIAMQIIERQAASEAESLRRERARILQNLTLRERTFPVLQEVGANLAPDAGLLGNAFEHLMPITMLSLDLSFGSGHVGLFYDGMLNPEFGQAGATMPAHERIIRLARHALQLAAEGPQPKVLTDTVLMAGGLDWRAHLEAQLALGSYAYHDYAVPSLTMAGTDDSRPHAFTPDDTVAHLNPDYFRRILEFTDHFLPALVNSAHLDATRIRRGAPNPLAVELSLRLRDEFSVGVPRTPLPGALLTAMPPRVSRGDRALLRLGEVNPYPMLIADESGRRTARGRIWEGASTFVFDYDPDYREVRAAIDFGEGHDRFNSTLAISRAESFVSRTLVAFDSRKTDIYQLYHPRSFEPLRSLELLDAAQDATPRNYSVAGIGVVDSNKSVPHARDGTASVFISPGNAFKLRVGGAPVLNSTAERPNGNGFYAETGTLYNVPLQSALDMQILTGQRLALLQSRGVTDDTTRELSERAGQFIQAADEKGEISTLDSFRAWSLSLLAYQQTLNTVNDLVRAVILLLALAIPFCYFLMKLLVPFEDINRQIVAFLLFMLVLIGVLFYIQPAFGISDRPMVVVLAFIIAGLAVFVGILIYNRFDGSMRQTIETMTGGANTQPKHGELAGVAFIVGVNNMKRRRMRTTLTCATVALVTFTMLSLISVQRSAEPTRILADRESPYDGMLFIRPGLGLIDPAQVTTLARTFGEEAEVLVRTWSRREGPFQEVLPFTGRVRQRDAKFDIAVLLGLSQQEFEAEGNQDLREALVDGRWFASNRAEEIILSRDLVDAVGMASGDAIHVGDEILIGGRNLRLVGLIDDERFGMARDLRALSLLPPSAEGDLDLGDDEVQQARSFEDQSLVRARDLGILPVETAMSFGHATVRALSIRLIGDDAAEAAWNVSRELTDYLDGRFTVGLSERVEREGSQRPIQRGQYIIAASTGTEFGGLMRVAIPTLLGASILLNTMLGAVMERKRDISIYNSIGLNPTHVMTFFLAEALVFGLVGAFGGYLVGQVLSLGLGQFLDLNLNYSSLSVVAVIFLSVLTVLASTIYPALLAARSAVPSGQRKWSLPKPEGDVLKLQFPFIYNVDSARGVCAYLHANMVQNSEASTGKFLARYISGTRATDSTNPVLRYMISPSPYDLGVNQELILEIREDPRLRAYVLSATLLRVAGERQNWIAVNQPFLEDMRALLLRWRTITAERQQTFMKEGLELTGLERTNRDDNTNQEAAHGAES